MNVSGLTSIAPPGCLANIASSRSRHASTHLPARGKLVDDPEADVVPGVAILRPRIAEADDQLHVYFLSLSLPFAARCRFAFLVGLALLDDLGLRRRRDRRRHRRRFRRRLFDRTRRDDVDEHHVDVADRHPVRALRHVAHVDRVVEPEVADVDLDRVGNLERQRFQLDFAMDEVDARRPPTLTPRGSPLMTIGTVTVMRRSMFTRKKSACSMLLRDRIEEEVLDQHARIAFAVDLERDEGVDAGAASAGCAGAASDRRRPASCCPRRLPSARRRRRRDLPGGAEAPRLVLAAGLTFDCFECRFHMNLTAAQAVRQWGWWAGRAGTKNRYLPTCLPALPALPALQP